MQLQRARDAKDEFKREYNATLEEQIWVFVNKEKHDAKLVHVSDKADYAILRVNCRFEKPFRLKTTPERLLDIEVRALGFPDVASAALSTQEERLQELRLQSIMEGNLHSDVRECFSDRDLQYVMTSGRICQVADDTATNIKWIQHDAGIAPGSSGGPLVIHKNAIVLGVNTVIVGDRRGGTALYRAIFLGQFRKDIDRHAPGVVWVP